MWVRRFADRMMHPLRRRRAAARLRAGRHPQSVLFLCYGNICRSPYAAAALEATLPTELQRRVHVSSAGYFGPDRTSPPEAVRAAADRGVDLTRHRSRVVTSELLAPAELVVVMDPGQAVELRRRFGGRVERVLVLGDLDPEAIETRHIQDPLNQRQSVFQATYARIDRCVRRLADLAFEVAD